MPNAYILNQRFSATTNGPFMSMIVEMLIAAGWTFRASGDGLSGFSSTGKIFSGTGTGAGGWGNTGAWARVADPGGPGGGREFVFQHTNTSGGARIKYSASARFTGGAPSATVVPTATDERYLRGDSGSYGSSFCPALTEYPGLIWQGAALATAPYGFWFAGQVVGQGTRYTSMMMDPVVGDSLDPDPVVLVIGDAGNAFSGIANGTFSNCMGSSIGLQVTSGGTNIGCWAHMDVAKTCFMPVRALGYTSGVTSSAQAVISGRVESFTYQPPYGSVLNINPYGAGVNPFNGKPEYLPVLWSRLQQSSNLSNWVLNSSNHNQYIGSLKGWSTMCRWTGMNRTPFSDTTAGRNKICVGAWWLPWDGVTAPLY